MERRRRGAGATLRWRGRVTRVLQGVLLLLLLLPLLALLPRTVWAASVLRAAGGSNVIEWDGGSWSLKGASLNGAARSMAVYNGTLYVGGFFDTTLAGQINCLAAWDGQAWVLSGAGVIHRLLVVGDLLVAAGAFTGMGSTTNTSNIAAFDGNEWAPLGSGTDVTVYTLAEFGGRLVAGGAFAYADGAPVNYIAQWDGMRWSALAGGTNNFVTTLYVYEGLLIVGGWFTVAGAAVPANYIALWDGVAWAPLGAGTDNVVYALYAVPAGLISSEVAGGNSSAIVLAVGGNFTSAGGLPSPHVAVWNGSAWFAWPNGTADAANSTTDQAAPAPFSDIVSAFSVFGGQLVAGGAFVSVGDVDAANFVATWNGTQWVHMARGINYYVADFATVCAPGWAGAGCDECATGFNGSDCANCTEGYYGPTCASCAATCIHGPCISGADGMCGPCDLGWAGTGCSQCALGWTGAACSECQIGFFGPNCTACTECVYGTCVQGIQGACTPCQVGWAGEFCDTCAPGYTGAMCTSEASNGQQTPGVIIASIVVACIILLAFLAALISSLYKPITRAAWEGDEPEPEAEAPQKAPQPEKSPLPPPPAVTGGPARRPSKVTAPQLNDDTDRIYAASARRAPDAAHSADDGGDDDSDRDSVSS